MALASPNWLGMGNNGLYHPSIEQLVWESRDHFTVY